MMILGMVFTPQETRAATYTWNQSDWSGGLDNNTFPDHTNYQTGWTKYFSKDSNIKLDSGSITFNPTTGSVTQTSSGDFGIGTTSNVVSSGSGGMILGTGKLASIANGTYYSCALKTDGTVWCWGNNASGQLGIGNTDTYQPSPVQVLGMGGTGVLSDVNNIAKGFYHACVSANDGTAYCWGQNSYGQLGNGNTITQTTPVQVSGEGGIGVLSGVSMVGGGYYHTCALKTDGTVYCWGKNSSGQLGIGNTANQIAPVQVLGAGGTGILSDVSAITGGENYTCALKTNGTVYCWGQNSYGQLGIGNNTRQNAPVQVLGPGGTGVLSDVSAVGGGSATTCAAKTDGTVYCWGYNNSGQLGIGNTANQTAPVQVLGAGGTGVLSDVSAVEGGYLHTCALQTDGTVYCWGYNNWGQVGIGSTGTSRMTPYKVLGTGGTGVSASMISTGFLYNCALKTDNTVYCWGYNGTGQLGIGSTTFFFKTTPVQVIGEGGTGVLNLKNYPASGNFISSAIDLGQNSTLTTLSFGITTPANTVLKFQMRSAATSAGLAAATWYGPTGTSDYYTDVGTSINSTISNKRFVQYKAFFESDSVNTPTLNDITVNYDYYDFPGGSSTQTSDADFNGGSLTSLSTTGSGGIQLLGGSGGTSQVSAGAGRGCVLKTNGTVWCWGDNQYGQLGTGNTVSQSLPTQVIGPGGTGYLTDVELISTSNGSHSCAVKTDGTAYCWGQNVYGQLGTGNTVASYFPVKVVGAGGTGTMTNIQSITIGNLFTCILKTDGSVWCWGENQFGVIGNNSSGYGTFVLNPNQVLDTPGTGYLTSITSISAGSYHVCASQSSTGNAYCWGYNQYGQIGVGNTNSISIKKPNAVAGGMGEINKVYAGGLSSCATKSTGVMYCWGYNNNGGLGIGNTTNQVSAVQVAGVSGGYLTSVATATVGNSNYACAVKTDGTAYCWGQNNGGMLGIGNTINNQKTPVQIVGAGGTGTIANVSEISASSLTLAKKTDGSVVSWGSNYLGGLGIGNSTMAIYPYPLSVLSSDGTANLNLVAYGSPGTLISSVIDLGVTSANLTSLTFGSTIPTNTTIKFQIRSADTSGGIDSATWYGPTGTSDYYTTTGTDINTDVSSKRYIQYKVILETTDGADTPILNDVTIGYKLPTLLSSLISSPYNTASDANLLSKIEWVKSTPTNTSVKFQMRTAANSSSIASADWKGPDGTSASYFTNNLGSETMPSSFTDGSGDQWIQYKAFLETTDTSASPTLYDVTSTYVVNAPPSFNTAYQTNGFGITAGTTGTFNFLYSVGDTDTDQGTIDNQYKIWPTFQYTLDNGATWVTIDPTHLTGPTSDNPIVLTSPSAYTTDTTLWNAVADLPNSYNTVKVRMILDDHEAANNTATITSEQFVVDTKVPVAGTPDGGGTGININHNTTTTLAADKTNNRNVTLYFSATDDSTLQLKYSTDADFTGANYQDYVASIGYTLSTGDGSKRIYVKFKDYYGNESAAYSDVIQLDTTAPTKPASLFVQDISNTATGEMRVFVNWAKSSDSDWLGYKVYNSTNGIDFNLLQSISNVNTNYILDTGITNAVTYTYKITAIDDLSNESVGSTVIQTAGGNPSDAISPTISSVVVSDKTTSSATITWTTNEVANSTVLYSTDSNYGNTQGSAGYTKTHSVTLAGLSAGTTYNFKVRSSDANGNATDSDASTFTTNEADVTGPVISNIASGSLTKSGATITFTTDETASSFVEYSTTSGFTTGNIFGQNDLTLTHSVVLKFLNPATTYYYKVRSIDALGNETISSQNSFTTSTSSADTTGPVISAVTTSSVAYNTATIGFTTDEVSSSFIEFGKDANYGRIYGQDNAVTTHSVILPYDLDPETIYYYRVRTKDISGNETIGIGKSFTTDTDPNDLVAPTISSVTIGEAGKNSITITWTTNEVADSYIGYSEDLNYAQEQGNPVMTTSHSITLVGLKPKTQYYFRIKSTDPSGNLATDNNSSQGYTFVTADGDNPPTLFGIQIKNVGSSSADIYWETNVYTNSYVEYGLDESYGSWAGINNLIDSHTVSLNGLMSGVTYDFRVRSKSANGAEGVSENFTLTTSGLATTAVGTTTIVTTSPSEDSLLETIKNGTVDFIKKVLNIIPDTQLSEGDFVDTMNSMSPKIVSSPSISSSNITVDPGVDKITITWTTDKKSNSVVAYVTDKDYVSTASDPYTTTAGNPGESVTNHSVEISNLNPNTTYHYQVRSKTEFGNWTKSSDFVFTTLSLNSEIRDLKFNEIKEKSVRVSWQTNFESRAMIEVSDILSGKVAYKTEEKGFDRSHSLTVNDLQTSTNYKLKIVTIAKDGTTSEESIYPFSTATSSNPPEISNVRISNALIPGAVEQVQTIVSWKTDKPSSSRIIYDEGLAKELKMSTNLDRSLVTDHIVVTTVLKTGKVYKFKVESVDSNGNVSLSKDYIIMTPKPQESVINLIIDNFTSSFSFITGKK